MYQESTDPSGVGVLYEHCFPASPGRICNASRSYVDPNTALLGNYVGTSNATRISDLPPSEGIVTEITQHPVSITEAPALGFRVAVDSGCTTIEGVFGLPTRILSGAMCTSQRILPRATLTVSSGTISLVGTHLSLRIEFRYSLDGDVGRFSWSYEGERQ